ncbi:MAG TPA: alpha-ketoglutarate-dependent dioxygenase AlkB [Nannocystaceae bacterium]|nr:alpha-ketoglutarate-dependent dioxygenase AlkB [Nannocystaceae bacterium]
MIASSAEVAIRLGAAVREIADASWIAHLVDFTPDDELAALVAELPLRRERIVIFGREVEMPRLTSWHGDPHASYRYSGRTFAPQPWTPTLAAIRERLAARTGVRFDAVLANYYRDGGDAMGWHSDDELELGPAAPHDVLVASVSLGSARRFLLRAKQGDARIELRLGGGDLLVMGGATQRRFRHTVPRERRISGPRLNLTFRLLRSRA